MIFFSAKYVAQGYVRVKASGGNISGSIKTRMRRDIPSLPDVDHKTQTYTILLEENQDTQLTLFS